MCKIKFSLITYVATITSVLVLLSIFGCNSGVQYRIISMEDYEDKVAGGWLGQAIGVLWGQDTEGRWAREIVPFDLEDWYRIKQSFKEEAFVHLQSGNWAAFGEAMNKAAHNWDNWEKYSPIQMSSQDDLYIEFLFLHSIQKYGLDVTATQMAEDWLSYIDPQMIWGANKAAYENFKKGIMPPLSGHPDNTPYGNAIDYQIEADVFGLISPGLPAVSNAWGNKVGHMMNYGDGVYAGMAMGAMYGEAFFENDPRKLVEFSLKVIPAESKYAEMVRDVIAAYDANPTDWQAAWQVIEDKWGTDSFLDVRINGAYVYMGLLYGEGDFWKTMNISMRCGMDSDCNPSSSVGILGTAMGLKNIPDKWAVLRDLPISNKSYFTEGSTISDIFPDPMNWDDVLALTVEVGRQNIIAAGGKIEDGIIYIPVQTPIIPALEQVPIVEEEAQQE